jgi:acyl-CoA dehydrogenase
MLHLAIHTKEKLAPSTSLKRRALTPMITQPAFSPDSLQQAIEGIRRFVRERLIPAEREVDETDEIPSEIVSEMRELGLFGLSIPQEYGGLGLNMEEEIRFAFELAQAAPTFRSYFGTNCGIGSQGIVLAGSDEQRRTYLPRLASGEIIGSFALTEPDIGSDAAHIKTTAVRNGDHYVVNGTKRYITNAPQASVFTVLARTNPAESGSRGISAFLVDASLKGIKIGRPDRKMGLRGSHTSDVIFDDVHVPASALLGNEGEGFKIAMRVLDRGRLLIAAACVGSAQRLIHESLAYATTRRQFGKAIGEFQLIQAMLADSKAEAFAMECMVLEAARRRDLGGDISLEAACSKMLASELVGRIADRAVQIHGGAGYMREYPVERFYRDVRLFRIYEGTTQIQQLLISQRMLKDFQLTTGNA